MESGAKGCEVRRHLFACFELGQTMKYHNNLGGEFSRLSICVYLDHSFYVLTQSRVLTPR